MAMKRHAQIRLAGTTYNVKCTFQVIEKIESRPKGAASLTLVQLANQLNTGANLSDFSWAIYCALRLNNYKKIVVDGEEKNLTFELVGDLVTDDGQDSVQEAITSVSNIIEACLGGAPEGFPESKEDLTSADDEPGKSIGGSTSASQSDVGG